MGLLFNLRGKIFKNLTWEKIEISNTRSDLLGILNSESNHGAGSQKPE
jgi:hypothetical protein